MAPSALDTSAAHPLYLYVVFVVCVLAAIALLIGASLSRRNSSWRRQMQVQTTQGRRPGPAYPVEPVTATVSEPVAAPEAAPAGKAAPRKATATATKRAPAKKTTAKKTPAAKKATTKRTQR